MWSASGTSAKSKDLSILGGISGTGITGRSRDQGSTQAGIAGGSSRQHSNTGDGPNSTSKAEYRQVVKSPLDRWWWRFESRQP
ncbi:unnamed protein product [Rotaria sp. Silwood2]|nr:unnamed protein product [Rotaria sp. Silwood2]CAF3015729.1 unnamed protein product [Rotaria sp. Silwood2]CAF3254999.1 unnamed protein product [Rotaria sp. Silwood2]CAF3411941.1 unnamed protein product [Rotaria sp. Silwood2]CAF4091028.1 unnamed protein product [Rotaria sp. Silwood2]